MALDKIFVHKVCGGPVERDRFTVVEYSPV